MKKLLTRYQNLKQREKILVNIFCVSISAGLYYNLFFKPLARNIDRYTFQEEKISIQLEEIKNRQPAISESQELVAKLNSESAVLLEKISDLEKRLPSQTAVSGLIGEMTRLASNLKLQSIRQKIDQGEEYSRIFVELSFDSPYHEVVRYIKSLEMMSPFFTVEELELSEFRKKKKYNSRIVISSLLGDMPFSERLEAKELGEEPWSDLRDIFVSKASPRKLKNETSMKLEGITYSARGSTAIVNGNVIRENSKVSDLTVKKILPYQVILTNGIEDYTLTVER